MKPPEGARFFDAPLTAFWIDESGILHGIAKNVPRDYETLKLNLRQIKEQLGEKPVPLVINVTNSSPYLDPKAREYYRSEVPKLYKAIALVSASPTGQMVATMMSVMIPHSIPTKMFSTREEAREWAQQYL